jgi:colanic acid biosynthesis glycosyl transferase WcaI
MKILLYSANFAPEPVGIGKYSGEMAAWLADKGHSVRVVCAPPYYPDWKVHSDFRSLRRWRETWSNVDVWRAPLWVPCRPDGLSRIVHLSSFALCSFPLMLRQVLWQPDVVLTVAPALVCAPTGHLVAWLSGAKSWLHIQDFEVDVAFQMGLLRGKRLQAVVSKMERWLYRRFDVLSSISGAMVRRLQGRAGEGCRAELLPNWVDMAHVTPLKDASPYRAELGIGADTKVALFSGTLGSKQGLMVVPEAAQLLLHRKDILFIVCGDGALKTQLQEAAQQLPNLLLLPLQPFERLGDLLGLADMHLLPQSPLAEDLVLPSKLSGMLASGRPVIATCHQGTEIAQVVAECGLLVKPGDSHALAMAIEQLADDDAGRAQMGGAGRRYAEAHLSRESVLMRLDAQLSRLITEDALGNTAI